jgi:RimJ/RimL family protein N-acetyltransferase
MRYRIATKDDISMLSEIRWEHEYEVESQFSITKEEFISECNSFLIKEMERGTWVYWIAEDEGNIIANIYVNRIRKVPKPQKLFAEIGYVTNVHTKKDYRNKGIGTELLKRVKQWAVDNNIELLFLWPSERSVSFYKREGFKLENEIMELELL